MPSDFDADDSEQTAVNFEPNALSTPEEASEFVTRLLLEDPFDPKRTRAAMTYLGPRFEFTLDVAQLTPATPEKVRKVVRRLFGTAALGDLVCRLVFPLHGLTQDGLYLGTVADAFGNFIGREYPETTKRYLTDQLATLPDGSEVRAMTEGVLKHLDEIGAMYEQLPILKELQIGTEKLAIFRSFKREEQREIHAIAEEMSIARLLTTNVSLKYGKAFVYRFNGHYSPVTPLGAFSAYIEVPFSERYDPVAGLYRRLQYLAESNQ